MNNYIKCLRTMLLCFIVILFICVVVGVIKYSTAHSLKQEKTLSYLRLIMKNLQWRSIIQIQSHY